MGGLIGSFDNSWVLNSYATGDVVGVSNVSSFIGYDGGYGITNCYATGNVTGTSELGSLVGSYASGGLATKSYAINDSLTAVGNVPFDTVNHCSYGFDAGCEIEYTYSSIKSTWDDAIWDDLADDTPLLAWQVEENTTSELFFSCDSNNDGDILDLFETDEATGYVGWEQDEDNNWLIGGASGNSLRAKQQLLCLSQNQTSEVLSANYKMTADVDFDIDFTVTKTYQDVGGNISATKDDAYKFLKTMSVVVNSNNEDWDGVDGVDDTSTEGWIPMGNSSVTFTGSFDGNNHTIGNLYINRPASDSQAFFGKAAGGEISNLIFNNIFVEGYYMAATLIGWTNSAAAVNNCHIEGNVYGHYRNASGFIGIWNAGLIENSSADVDVFSTQLYTSGFISSNSGTLLNNHVSGDVKGGSDIGGFTGPNYGVIENCYYTGNIIGGSYVGGISGYNASGSIINSYVTGDVKGSSTYVGGLVGWNASIINNSYAAGTVTGAGLVGGLLGSNGTGTITESYAINDGLTAVGDVAFDTANYCSYTFDAGCKVPYSAGSIKSTWDDAIWDDLADDTPLLAWQVEENTTSEMFFSCDANGDGDILDLSETDESTGYVGWEQDEDNNWLIGGVAGNSTNAKRQLLCLSQKQAIDTSILSADYKLMADVDFDISWELTKTFENLAGDTSTTEDSSYKFLNNITLDSTLNNEDWDGDGVVGDADDDFGWIPIGDYGTSTSLLFTGSFDGNNHAINNLYINDPATGYRGFLGRVDNAGNEIENLSIKNAFVISNGTSGVLGGKISALVDNCSVEGTISSPNNFIGLFLGTGGTVKNSSSSGYIKCGTNSSGFIGGYGSIENCHSDIKLKASGYSIGGLAGTSPSMVKKSTSTGTIRCSSAHSGGLVGYTSSTVEESYSSVDIKGSSVGGLVGTLSGGSIINSYSTGELYGSSVGGLVNGPYHVGGKTSTVTNSYTTSNILSSPAGAIARLHTASYSGLTSYLYIYDSYALNDDDIPAFATAVPDVDVDNYCSYTADEGCNVPYTSGSIKATWDDAIWENLGDNAPKLEWETEGDIDSEVVFACDANGDNSILDTDDGWEQDGDGNWLIGGVDGDSSKAKSQLLCLSQKQSVDTSILSANYKMTADVDFDIDFTVTKTYQDVDGNTNATKDDTYKFLYDMSVVVNSNNEDWDGDGTVGGGTDADGWIPIGDYSTSTSLTFRGDFDGDGHTISNLYVNRSVSDYQALFGRVSGVVINNFSIEDSYVSGNQYVGGLVGYASTGSAITSCYSTGDVSSSSRAGGLVGRILAGATVTSSYTTGDIYGGRYTGGIAGLAYGEITSCYSTGNITGSSGESLYVGGITGYGSGVLIQNSYSTSAISVYSSGSGSYAWVGGIAGYFRDSAIMRNCYFDGNLSSRTLDSSYSWAGGLVAGLYAGAEIYNSYAVGNLIEADNREGALVAYWGYDDPIITQSYAINDSLTAVSGVTPDLANYCSYGFDAGCDIAYTSGSIKATWDDDIWEDLVDDTPKLEWETEGDISSVIEEVWTCVPADPLAGMEQDGYGNYLLGGLIGDSENAKKQLLCMSQNQTAAVLSADYKLMADVDFDIDFTVTKTCAKSDNTTSGSPTLTNLQQCSTDGGEYEFLDTMSMVVNSNNEDWDGSGTVGDGTDAEGWISFAAGSSFTGNFDGNNHKISNLYINRPDDDYQAFIYKAAREIKDLTLENAYLTAYSYSAVLASELTAGGVVDNCLVTGNLKGTYRYNAGLVRRNYGLIKNSSADLDLYAGSMWSGTFAAYNYGTIDNCHSSGDSHAYSHYACGLAAMNYGTVSDTYATGNMKANYSIAGGLVCVNYEIIEDSYATGDVMSSNNNYPSVGGLVSSNMDIIRDSYATGNVYSKTDNTGGLVGKFAVDGNTSANAIIENSYATGNVESTRPYAGGLVGYVEGDASNNFTIRNSYATGAVTGLNSVGGLIGRTEMSSILGSHATGSVDGSGVHVGGLAGWAGTSLIEDSYATGSVSGADNVGGLGGYLDSPEISNSYATGSVSGGNNIGGLAGLSTDLEIYNSYATGDVTGGAQIGGLLGNTIDANSCIIENSYATGFISGSSSSVGGLVGNGSNDFTIINSYAAWATPPSGTTNVGGLVGSPNATINNAFGLCEYVNEVTPTACTENEIYAIQEGGAALEFDGVDDYIQPTAITPSLTHHITAKGWFNDKNNDSWSGIAISMKSSSAYNGMWLGYNGSTNKFKAFVGPYSTSYIETTSSYTADGSIYYEVELISNGTTFAIWVNGEKASADKAVGVLDNVSLITRIGRSNTTANMVGGAFEFVEFETDGVVRATFIPQSDGTMLDTVSSVSYGNAGTGTIGYMESTPWGSSIWSGLGSDTTPSLK